MKILSLSDRDLTEAAEALSSGAVVAFPTETVYGLGADAFNTSSIARIFNIKNRPTFDPLIIHIASMAGLDNLVNLEEMDRHSKENFFLLAKNFWPGPLTVVLPKQPAVPDLATSGLPTAGIRFPAFPAAQKLISLSGKAIAAPSANPFGCLSPTKADHVISQLGDKPDFIIDGGQAVLGLESTVLDLSSDVPVLLRPGFISREQIESITGPVKILNKNDDGEGAALSSPGLSKSHYAPHTPLRIYPKGTLKDEKDFPDEGKLYFSGSYDTGDPRIKVLTPEGSLEEAAANFFDMLHNLDGLGLKLIKAEEAPSGGIGEAINDRLRRASAAF